MNKANSKEVIDDDGGGIFEENIIQTQEGKTTEDINDLVLSQSIDADKQYIIFTIGDEEYATQILSVQEIRGWMKTTPLPNTPEYVRGVTNLRGNIVPVFDLRARFTGDLTEVTERHVVIMVEINSQIIGLLVDSISDILTIDTNQIQPAPTSNLTVDTQYIDGLFASDERMVALVNINKLFDQDVLQSVINQK